MENIKIPYLRNENDAKEKAGEYLKNIFNEQILTIDSIKLMINLCHKKENQYIKEDGRNNVECQFGTLFIFILWRLYEKT